MVLGTDKLYREFGIERTAGAETSDIIVIGGSGGMLEKMRWINGIFRDHCHRFADKPVCVLPSTFYYPSRPFAEEIGDRRGTVTLFCRETYSYKHLCDAHALPHNCQVELDQDMAFELRNTELIERLKGRAKSHVLIVERTDVEHPTVALHSRRLGLRRSLGRLLPLPVKRCLYPLVTYVRARKRTTFREQCERLIEDECRVYARWPRLAKDISNVNTGDFGDFCDAVARAAVVFTTRLHVGILSSMLGTPTYLFGGPYHKIRGIYEFSLASLPHVRYCELNKD